MRILTVIPAKGTSSRIPRKNMQDLGGKPLFTWTVDAAKRADLPDNLVVVSTDDDEIAHHAVEHHAVVLRRPPELCRDPAQMPDVALHALERFADYAPDVVMVLLPTSPFRTAQHVREAMALHRGCSEERNVVSVNRGTDLRWKFCRADHIPLRIVDGPPARMSPGWPWGEGTHCCALLLNGAVWIAPAQRLRVDRHISAVGALPYVMDEESGLDIDTPADLAAARWIVAQAITEHPTEYRKLWFDGDTAA